MKRRGDVKVRYCPGRMRLCAGCVDGTLEICDCRQQRSVARRFPLYDDVDLVLSFKRHESRSYGLVRDAHSKTFAGLMRAFVLLYYIQYARTSTDPPSSC